MERMNGAARAARALTGPQQTALVRLGAGNVRVRKDIVDKLRALDLVTEQRRLTDGGRLVRDEIVTAMRHAAGPPRSEPVNVVDVLTEVDHRRAPKGVPGAVARLLFDLTGDRDRVGALAWLAGPEGAAYLGALKDAFIADARRGRTYEQTAAHLGTTVRAVNRAVSQHNVRRQSEVDNSIRTGG